MLETRHRQIALPFLLASLALTNCSDESKSAATSSAPDGSVAPPTETGDSSTPTGTPDGSRSDANAPECTTGAQCASGVCQSNRCVPATCTDGVKNASETDVDCGGSCAVCADGKGCAAGTDCGPSSVCGSDNKCRTGRSCFELAAAKKPDGLYDIVLPVTPTTGDAGVADAAASDAATEAGSDAGASLTTRVYCDNTTAGGGWTLVAYAEQSALAGKLHTANGSFDAATRTGSANVAALGLARRSVEAAITWATGTPTGNIASYEHGVAFPIPQPESITLEPSTTPSRCHSPNWTSVPVIPIVGSPALPSRMYTMTASMGAVYGSGYGLVAPSLTEPQCDWQFDSQNFRALYLGTGPGVPTTRRGVVNEAGGGLHTFRPNMALWFREAAGADGVKNGLETDVDCGGNTAKCTAGKACGSFRDCASGICTAGQCAAPAKSCYTLRSANPLAPSGNYVIDVDGVGTTPAFPVWCDMDTDGGGWTRCGNMNETASGNATMTLYERGTGDPFPTTAGTQNDSFCEKLMGSLSTRALLVHNKTPNYGGGDYGVDQKIKVTWGANVPALYTGYATSPAVSRCENLTTNQVFSGCRYAAHAGFENHTFSFTINNVTTGYTGQLADRLLLGVTHKKGNTTDHNVSWHNFGAGGVAQSLANTWVAAENVGDFYLRDDLCGDGQKNGDETDVDCGGVCGRCAATTACTVDASCASGRCSAGTCTAPFASCKALLDAVPTAPSGVYTIAPGGLTVRTYCDMDFRAPLPVVTGDAGISDGSSEGGSDAAAPLDGSGWTLITTSALERGANALVAGDVIPQTPSYMPLATMQALANASSQIHIRTRGRLDRSATSKPNTAYLTNLRNGRVTNQGLTFNVNDWLPSQWVTDRMWFSCPVNSAYPAIYHACNNGAGLHFVANESRWNLNSLNEPVEVYVR